MIEIPILQLHIPKTAGSTLNAVFRSLFPADQVFTCGNNHTGLNHWDSNLWFISQPDEEKLRYRYINGHVEFFLLQSYPAQHFSFTFLRNPLDRMVSMYYYILRNERHHLHERIVEQELTLAQTMRAGFWQELDNGMVRRISGVAKSVPYGKISHDALELAKHNLQQNISFFGLQERFDESLFLLLHLLEAQDKLVYSRSNTTKGRKKVRQLGKEDTEAILEFNQLDVQLYDFARELYRERYGDLLKRLEKPLASYKKAMALAG